MQDDKAGITYPGTHDDHCESIAVDIGVGEMHSPCGCMERWYQCELNGLHDELDRVTVVRSAGRDHVIEECAKVCDGRAEYWQEKVNEGSEENGYETVELRQAAYAIRALKNAAPQVAREREQGGTPMTSSPAVAARLELDNATVGGKADG